MDVRCEKCLTVYELDDAKVGDAGLTVKCQECGNLFKVRRRPDTAELVVPTVDDAESPSDTIREIDLPKAASGQGASGQGASGFASDDSTGGQSAVTVARRAQPKPEERGWMLRSASSGEVLRFRELTTLQQWIVERKVTRQDQISRGGESWKELGGIAELASFFHVVEQAEAVAHASQPGLAMQRSAEEPAGALPDLPTEILAQAPRRRGRQPSGAGPTELGLGDTDDETMIAGARVPRSNAAALVVGAFFIGAAIAAGAYFLRKTGPRPEPAAAELAALAQRGRTALLTDTDEGFRQAISSLDKALELAVEPGVDPARGAVTPAVLAVRADLAEAHVTWAAYLLEDAHKLETGAGAAGAQAARTLRAEAQSHLERARHVLEEAGGAEAATGALARAFGDLLRVEGGAAAAAERYLERAAHKGVDDPELAYALGELALREGKAEEAQTHLAEAARGADGGLVRAHYRLAVLAHDGGRAEALRRECDTLDKLAPKHDRAHALCTAAAAPDLGAAARPMDGGTAGTAGTAGTTVTAAVEPATPKPREPGLAPPMDYKSLVREADRLQENGHSKEARKVYEHALEVDPRGVAALTGLGYCDLDAERFMQAVDRFNAALAVDPTSGDAIVGLAESYKVRGQTQRAIDQYKKYLAAHPDGPKAQMAKKNLRDLEPKAQKEGEAKGEPDKPEAKERKDTSLPRPPADEPPPP